MPQVTADTPLGLILLALAGFFASGVNSFAGGGTLVSFPVLIGLGIGDLQANATNSMALWPGSLSSAFGYKERLGAIKSHLVSLAAATVLGATLGAYLLVQTPASTFRIVIPFLILLATCVLAAQSKIKSWVLKRTVAIPPWCGWGFQFLISVYGGYFGAGMGIMMLAAMSLFVEGDLHDLNALKNPLAVLINVVAMSWFLAKGLVLLLPCLALMFGAVVGGYVAARFSLRVSPDRLRSIVVIYGLVMTLWFFVRLR